MPSHISSLLNSTVINRKNPVLITNVILSVVTDCFWFSNIRFQNAVNNDNCPTVTFKFNSSNNFSGNKLIWYKINMLADDIFGGNVKLLIFLSKRIFKYVIYTTSSISWLEVNAVLDRKSSDRIAKSIEEKRKEFWHKNC